MVQGIKVIQIHSAMKTQYSHLKDQVKRSADEALVWYRKECNQIVDQEKKMIQDFILTRESKRNPGN